MRSCVLVLFLNFLGSTLIGQEYKVTARQNDAFSVALVKLMNCAANGFKECQGKIIRSTSLMGDDHQLTIAFPGSAAAIIRIRDWEKNAYIEFRGYADKQSRIKGVHDIIAKIKNALGDQFYDDHEGLKKDDVDFYGLAIKDRNGFFAMNMEILSGSSSAPIYLLGPEQEDESKPQKDFVLLKIYNGIPSYQYYIRQVTPPDKKLNETIRQVIRAAERDFDTIPFNASIGKQFSKKKSDTIDLNGSQLIMDYHRGSHCATLSFPASIEGQPFHTRWSYYKRVLQAGLGSGYVYQFNKLQDEPYILFFSKDHNEKKPRIYLETQPDNLHPAITIRVESGYPHETNRGMSGSDL